MRGRAHASRIESQPAYVLHRRAWRESSALLEVFSAEFGRVGLVVRGLRGARSQSWQAMLQPMQAVVLSWSGNGELPLVTQVEPAETRLDLRGEAVLAGLYLNELMLALLPRYEANLELFVRYGECLRQQLAADAVHRAWHLRLFERDLLSAIGFPLPLNGDGESGELRVAASYIYVADQGCLIECDPTDRQAIAGEVLIALRDSHQPEVSAVAACRRWLREVLSPHLGNRELHAWSLMHEIRRL